MCGRTCGALEARGAPGSREGEEAEHSQRRRGRVQYSQRRRGRGPRTPRMCTSYACAHDKQRPMSVLRFYGARRLPPCPWSNTDHLSLALFPLFSPPFFSFSLYFRPSCPRLSGSRLLNVSQSPPSLRAGIRSRLELDRCRVPSRIPWGRESLGCVTPRLGFEKTRSWQRTLAQGPGAHPSFTAADPSDCRVAVC